MGAQLTSTAKTEAAAEKKPEDAVEEDVPSKAEEEQPDKENVLPFESTENKSEEPDEIKTEDEELADNVPHKTEEKSSQTNTAPVEPEEKGEPSARSRARKEPIPLREKSARIKNQGAPNDDHLPATDETTSTPVLNKYETRFETITFECTKLNKQGKTTNFCISSWNVNGLRAWIKRDGLEYIQYEKPDIFCIQESKCSTDTLPPEIKELEGYKQFWHDSVQENYAGVGLLTRIEPISISYGIGNKEHDDEGRCITAEFEKFYVVSVFVPNAGRKLVALPKRLEWNSIFKDFIKKLNEKKPVIICGDMGVAHSEIDLAQPRCNIKRPCFTKEERDGLTEFLADGYVDTYRSFYPDQTGAFTFWSYQGRANNTGWRRDYFIVSNRFMDCICDNVIRSDIFCSDHCPIALFLHI